MAKKIRYSIYKVLNTKLKNVGITRRDNRKDVVRDVKKAQGKGIYIAMPTKTFLKARDMIIIKNK